MRLPCVAKEKKQAVDKMVVDEMADSALISFERNAKI
jgi:hypothetical protein